MLNKIMINRLTILLISCFLYLYAFQAFAAGRCQEQNKIEICVVSVINLIANPKTYDGKIVLVSGYYRSGWELSALFVNKDYALLNDGPNGVWVGSIPEEDIGKTSSDMERLNQILKQYEPKLVGYESANNNYVKLGGVFKAGNQGHLGQYNGKIVGAKQFIVQQKW